MDQEVCCVSIRNQVGDKIKSNYIITNGKIINEERVLVENFKILGLCRFVKHKLQSNDKPTIDYFDLSK